MSEEEVTIRIPKSLYEQIQELIKDSEWKTVDDFVKYVLERVVREMSEEEGEEEEVYTKEEEEQIKERLRALGYL